MDQLMKLSAIFSIVDHISEPLKKITNNFMNCEKMVKTGNAWQEHGQKLGLTAAVVNQASEKMKATISDLKAPYMELEDATLALQTVTTSTMGSMDKSMEMTRQKALAWSKQHKESAASYVQTTYQMASAGLTDVQAIAATETAMRTARATMGDSQEAAALIAVAYNNMGDKSKDAQKEIGKLGDIITKTQQAFQIKNLNQLSEGLKYAIPTALQFGQSFEEINVAVGALNNAGLVSGQAGTAYAAAMRQMNNASAQLGFEIKRTATGGIDFIGTLENINSKYGAFKDMAPEVQEAFKKAFGDEGLRVISLLSTKTGDMRKQLEGVANSAGTAAAAQATMESSQSSKMQIAANRLDAVKIDFAERLLKSGTVVNQIIPKFATLVEYVANLASSFMDANPNFTAFLGIAIMATAAILAILAPILTLGAGVVSTAGVMVSGFGRASQAVLRFYTYIQSGEALARFRNLTAGIGSSLSSLRAMLVSGGLAAKNFALQMLAAGKAAAVSAASGIKTAVIGMAQFARQAIITTVTALPGLIASTWAWTAALLANPITWIVLAVVAVIALCIYYWDDLKAAAISAWDSLVSGTAAAVATVSGWFDAFVNYLAELGNSIVTTCSSALDSLVGWIDGLQTTFFTSGAALWEAFANGIQSMLNVPADAVMSGLQRIRNMLPFSDAKVGPLSQLTKSGKAIMATIASGVPYSYGNLQAAVAGGFDSLNLMPVLPIEPQWDNASYFPLTGSDEQDKERQASRGNNTFERRRSGLAIYGNVTLKVNQMNKTDEFIQALKTIADQEGDGDED